MAGLDVGDENVALRAQGLDETAAIGLLAEDAADLADVHVDDAVVGHVFAVQDAGEGFARQRLERVFEEGAQQGVA